MTNEILTDMAENEHLISELYCEYGKKIKNFSDFWSHLSGEEIRHQNMVLLFQQKVQAGEVYMDEDRFKKEPVKLFGEFLTDKISEAKANSITMVDGLLTAVDLEKSLLESDAFTIFESDTAELKTLLATLEKETNEHLAEVKEELEFIKAKQ